MDGTGLGEAGEKRMEKGREREGWKREEGAGEIPFVGRYKGRDRMGDGRDVATRWNGPAKMVIVL